ncbi:heterokaryon incompatibility protein-domain-containing protein [Cercophora newfieldiana]|uniref:Heterokaryon incompatibility protein-domain-containing protein n=1 Tax=Cercophora newfieldiana TaxID=92897 RepID=A0AA39YSX5_9PEZI|nr:heterokaryon incompatibility protein-domain-containing protein [Cercophora newfieldiana]
MAREEHPSLYRQYAVPHGTRQTRLLHIKPAASRDAQLQASMRICKIDSPGTTYETLSYVWGDQSIKKHSITVDDTHTFPLTEGLASALRYLRKPDGDLCIWIDAISINQQDKEEKADQVAIMGDIYRGATHVNIWLPGPTVPAASLETTASLKSVFSFVASDHFHDMPGYSKDPKTGQLVFEETGEFTTAWEGFRLVAESPWWTRAWTVQEAILPPQLHFLYGTAEPCDFDIMAKAMDNYWRFGKHLDACCTEAILLFPRDKMDTLGTILDMVGHVGSLFLRRSLGRGRTFDGRDNFYMIMRAFASRSCLEPRDRLYALWSQTVNDSYRVHKLSYTRPLREVYTEVFKCMIREAQGHPPPYPGIDFRVFFGPDFGPGGDRPSWVPSFAGGWHMESVQANIRRLGGTRTFRAAAWKKCKLTFSGDNELHLDGNYADRIVAVGLPLTTNELLHTGCKAVFDQWREMIRTTKTATGPRDKKLASLLCGGIYFGHLPRRKRLAKNTSFFIRKSVETHWGKVWDEIGLQMMANNELWRRAVRKDYMHEDFHEFWADGDFKVIEDIAYSRTLATALLDRAMFVTEGGRMGLCWPHAKAGDEVWVLYGSKMPFVMRPDGEAYNMVGDCYLQGAMDGEFARGKGMRLVVK